ncbi:MAG: NAD-dependent epimerase/dehydratase family protein [Gammaproteobacteria bacterium]
MKILVTGAAGNLGKIVCSELIEDGHSVVGIDLLNSDLQHKNYHHIRNDLTKKSELLTILADCECIVHSAVYVGNYNENLKRALETNILGTINLYECAKDLKIRKIVLLSSAPVDKEAPVNDPLKWISHTDQDHLYDLTKRLQEEVARDYAETFNISTIVLRLGHIVNGATNSDLAGNPLKNLNYCLGGWVDCHDAASACVAALKLSDSNFEIFNIIGSYQKENVFNIKNTIQKLGWEPKYRFNQE